MCLLVVYKLN